MNIFEDFKNVSIQNYDQLKAFIEKTEAETVAVTDYRTKETTFKDIVFAYEVYGLGFNSHLYKIGFMKDNHDPYIELWVYDVLREHAKSIADLPGKPEDYLADNVRLCHPNECGSINVTGKSVQELLDYNKDVRLRSSDGIVCIPVVKYLDTNAYLDHKCLGDINMSPETRNHNQHLVFPTKELAKQYLDWAKKNTSIPEPFYVDYDYDYDYDYAYDED